MKQSLTETLAEAARAALTADHQERDREAWNLPRARAETDSPEGAQQGAHPSFPVPKEPKEQHMFATIRRYEGVDQERTTELTSKVNETLVPKLRTLTGFAGYYLIEAENGVFSSLSLFETAEQGSVSSKVVEAWIRDEKLETMIPNPPKITSGEVIAHTNGGTVA
jgi:hypothetical protein